MDFNGKIAIVTGGSSGIGKATVQLLLKQGAKVIVLDLKPIDINVNKETLFYYDIDVTDENQVSSLIRIISEKFNLINILINSAGVTARNAFDQEVSEYELWKKVLEVNLNGTYLVSREVVKVMIEQNHGSIVNLSSIMGQVVYPEYLNSLTSPYPISKGGIVQYTKNLASFVGNKNIRVNCVSPAFIYTDLTKNILDDEFLGTKLKDQHPMKRFGTPEEVAETICFLASDKASFITGVDLPCDGGYLIL
ncbi:MAG TPA: SDR family oxidoreductase [Dehalococcoidia bacterium]|nr:SDR family oxidoreductase [Dehalococcoidia bacterium]